ncbi:MAG: FAD:protein FMN transferase [Rhizobiaceae bacterium]|nr:FAD:protein FMN transferase [Rhizobiaceae bacterium]
MAGTAPIVLSGPAFGAGWTFAAAGPFDEGALRRAFDAVIASVDASTSPFRSDSEVARFNRADTIGWQPLSPATCAVLDEALRVAQLTGGVFNPTVGPVVGRYGFGPIIEGEPGSPQDIVLGNGEARKRRASLSLDLCGIAKGHALDRMADACRELGLTDFLVELGGEVFATGRHPSGRHWQVGVESPTVGGAFQRIVALDGTSLATSGNRVNAYRWGGKGYTHIIDPSTGMPADSALGSVTVAAGTAMRADALATALYAMGPERGPAFARGAGVRALFILTDGTEIATDGFEELIH